MNKLIKSKRLFSFFIVFFVGGIVGCVGVDEEAENEVVEEIEFYEEEGFACFDKDSVDYEDYLAEMELDYDFVESLPDGEQDPIEEEDEFGDIVEVDNPIAEKTDLGNTVCILEAEIDTEEIEDDSEEEVVEEKKPKINAKSIAESGKYILLAQKFFLANRLQSSLNAVNRAIKLNPYSALAYQIRGSIFYKVRFFGKAKKAWEKALKLDPTLYRVRMYLETIYF
jgi:tetratricopeptide (TPR) repeat protein